MNRRRGNNTGPFNINPQDNIDPSVILITGPLGIDVAKPKSADRTDAQKQKARELASNLVHNVIIKLITIIEHIHSAKTTRNVSHNNVFGEITTEGLRFLQDVSKYRTEIDQITGYLERIQDDTYRHKLREGSLLNDNLAEQLGTTRYGEEFFAKANDTRFNTNPIMKHISELTTFTFNAQQQKPEWATNLGNHVWVATQIIGERTRPTWHGIINLSNAILSLVRRITSSGSDSSQRRWGEHRSYEPIRIDLHSFARTYIRDIAFTNLLSSLEYRTVMVQAFSEGLRLENHGTTSDTMNQRLLVANLSFTKTGETYTYSMSAIPQQTSEFLRILSRDIGFRVGEYSKRHNGYPRIEFDRNFLGRLIQHGGAYDSQDGGAYDSQDGGAYDSEDGGG